VRNSSFDGRLKIAYRGMEKRVSPNCRARKHYFDKSIKCDITFNEFYDFWYANRTIIEGIISDGGKPSVDRIDSDDDYRVDNLQIIPMRLNSSRRDACSSSTKGVRFDKNSNKWYANNCHGGKRHHIGSYETEAEAAKAIELYAEKQGVSQH